MKLKLLLFLICGASLLGCQGIQEEDLSQLNGYWEIKNVEKTNGKELQYKFNETVDFLKIDGKKGIRKKLKPTLEGKYITIGTIETFTITKEGEKFVFHYKTDMDEWQETLLELDEDSFQVKNDRDITYTYQRFKGYLDGTE